MLLRAAAIRFRLRQISQANLSRPYSALVAFQNLDSLLFRPSDVLFLPATWSPTILVLDEQMCGTDLPLGLSCVLRHIFL